MSPLEWVLREFLVGSRLGFALAFVMCGEGSCRAPPSARQAEPSLGKGSRCAAMFDGWRPFGLGRSGGGFRFALLAQRKRPAIPGRPPTGLFRPPVLGSSCRAEGGARQLARHGGGWVGRATPAAPRAASHRPFADCWWPHPGGKRAGPRVLDLLAGEGSLAMIGRGLSALARLQCTASFARHRVANRGPARFPPG